MSRSSDAISHLVRRSGLSQAEVARRLGTSPSRMSTYCTGRATPSADLLLRLVELVDDLVRDDQWSPTGTARGMAHACADGDPVWALKLALQACRRAAARNDPLWERPPAPVLGPEWATLLAGLAGRAFRDRGLPEPRWAAVSPLAEMWAPLPAGHTTRTREPAGDLAALGIVLDENDLVTL